MLPFASGTAPAAKGVITEMCSASQRVDALNALTLVENIGRLSTLGLFGFVFAVLANAGKPHLTFICNAVRSHPFHVTIGGQQAKGHVDEPTRMTCR